VWTVVVIVDLVVITILRQESKETQQRRHGGLPKQATAEGV
jgi:hypothetical protein